MDLDRQQKSKTPFIFFVLVFLAALGLVYLFIQGRNQFVSPVPKEPSFSVIYYTPTPISTTPTSTPSATPKPTKVPVTSAPTKTVTPTAKASVSPTVTVAPSPTAKPT